MQLQAERDNFVQAGIGGSASSPTTDSPLSLLSIGSLKKPRAKKTKGIPPPPPPKQAPLTSASAPVHVDEPAVEKSSSTEAFNSSLPLHLPVPLSLSLSLASPVSLVSPQDQSLPTTTVQHAHLISDQSDDAILTNAETTGSTTQSELTAASTGNHRLLEESDILSRFPFELLIVILRFVVSFLNSANGLELSIHHPFSSLSPFIFCALVQQFGRTGPVSCCPGTQCLHVELMHKSRLDPFFDII